MKKFPFLVIALLFAGGIAAAFAFSTPAHQPATKAAVEIAWFEYDPQFEGGTENPQNYHKLTGAPECDGNGDLCAIEADVMTGDVPDLENIYGTRLKP